MATTTATTQEMLLNPFQHERLTPQHLALLFPAAFYQNDESLALHLTGLLSSFSSLLEFMIRRHTYKFNKCNLLVAQMSQYDIIEIVF